MTSFLGHAYAKKRRKHVKEAVQELATNGNGAHGTEGCLFNGGSVYGSTTYVE